ncbi:MAG: protein kinase [Leptolyngbyaceae cyanobacterium RU_5_1]|nr:protein kinase [Leptolyngbyaceae cyanobacterium RU_5_1]
MNSTGPKNPYIIGRPITEPELFYGREVLFQFIEDNLLQGVQVILLHGQRRIGKSSVLAQIPNVVRLEQFVFVPLSLEGKSQKSLNEVLYELARDILEHVDLLENKVSLPTREDLDKDQQIFADQFLPQVCEALGDRNLVLLLDEFDALGDHKPDAAINHFFPYLQSIVREKEKLFIIPVVGRRLDDMPNLLSLFREAPSQEIGLLDRRSAERLITKLVKGVLEYEADAIDAILELSAGHPYFTQVICFALFVGAREEQCWQVTRANVEKVVDWAIEIGEGGLAWFWDGLPIPERLVFLATAETQQTKISNSTTGDRVSDFKFVLEGEPLELLQKYGIILTKQLQKAEVQLLEWNFLEHLGTTVDPNSLSFYKVTIELVRRWLVKRYTLRQEIRELENLAPEVQPIYEEANRLLQRGDASSAIKQYEQILAINPNYISALFDLAEGYLDIEEFDKAVELYTRTNRINPIRTDEGRLQLQQKRNKSSVAAKGRLDGRYRVVEVLGFGSSAQTYVAEDTHRPGNPKCVLKHLKPARTDPDFLPTARRLFNSEAETLEQLGNHDQIPRLIAYFEENQEFYLVQEFIEGNPLSAELPLGLQWTEGQVVQLLKEVLSILEFVHSKGVIHRDIKPDNLIRRHLDRKLVLIDFGAVKQIAQALVNLQEQPDSTIAIATSGYLPTEQSQGKPRFNSDIYALGIIGIQALTGLSPNDLQEDSNTGEIVWEHLISVSPGLAKILTQMVRYHFKDRYQRAMEVLHDLEELSLWGVNVTLRQSTYPDIADSRYESTMMVESPENSSGILRNNTATQQHPSRYKNGLKVIIALLSLLALPIIYTRWQVYKTAQTVLNETRFLLEQGKYETCVNRAKMASPDSHFYVDVQNLLYTCQLAQAKKLAAERKFKEAITKANQIPANSTSYQEARKLIEQWLSAAD